MTTSVWTIGADAASGVRHRWARSRRFFWHHPEWWSLAACACAWLALIASSVDLAPTAIHRDHAGQLMSAPRDGDGLWAVALEVRQWLLMVVAMMVPSLVSPIQTTAVRSLWRRRHRAIAAFLAGYLVTWSLCGVALAVIVSVTPINAGETGGSAVWLAMACAAAAVWQLAPAKRRALVACHQSRPLAPRGWRASRDCVMFGWAVARRCLVSCWGWMMVCVVARHNLPIMAMMTGLAVAERTSRHATARTTCLLLLTAAALCLISAIGERPFSLP